MEYRTSYVGRIRAAIARALFKVCYERIVCRRHPDQIIGKPRRPYLLRWYFFGTSKKTGKPRRPFGYTVYLHCFVQDDSDRALHDHPWDWWSMILDGGYTDHRHEDDEPITSKDMRGSSLLSFDLSEKKHYDDLVDVQRRYTVGSINRGKAEDAHRISLFQPKMPTTYNNEWAFYHCRSGGFPQNVMVDIVTRCEPREPCWTLFVMGRWKRDWGFHTDNGWVPWREFVDN